MFLRLHKNIIYKNEYSENKGVIFPCLFKMSGNSFLLWKPSLLHVLFLLLLIKEWAYQILKSMPFKTALVFYTLGCKLDIFMGWLRKVLY